MLTLFICLAYAAWIAALASLWCRGMCRNRGIPEKTIVPADTLACLFALVACLCIPPGSLPPLWNTAWSGAMCLVCLLVSLFRSCRRQGLVPSLSLCLTGVAVARYAWLRGLPGSVANLGTYVSVPWWQTASPWELVAFVLLGTSFLAAMRAALPEAIALRSSGSVVPLFAWSGVFVSVFFPLTLAPFLAWPLIVTAVGDFVLFWGKILVLGALLLRIPVRSLTFSWLSFVGSCAGAVILSVMAP